MKMRVPAAATPGTILAMTSPTAPPAPPAGPRLTLGGHDAELDDRLTAELRAFNDVATGGAERGELSVRVTDDAGELVGGLTAWVWGGLCGVDMLWVREDCRKSGWGSELLRAAEAEARRRGCDRMAVSSFTFQAPGFYERHGFTEVGRSRGIPGGHEDVHLYKALAGPASA